MDVTWTDAVGSTADPAFVVTAGDRIAAWNVGMTQLVGLRAEAACGRRCHEVVQARDVLGQDFCREACPVRRAATGDAPVAAHALVVRDAGGASLLVRQTVLRLGEPRALLHVLVPIVAPGAEIVAPPAAHLTCPELTPRENEVLALLEQGLTSAAISRRLAIAEATARHHVEHIIRKLGVHGRGQAVHAARRVRNALDH